MDKKKFYLVSWTEKHQVACSVEVEALNEEDAIEMVQNGDVPFNQIDTIMQDCLDSYDYEAEET